jgi:alpha-D-xyloside xylohydrolase
MPLYVRAGSILPMAPESEYSNQHPDAPVELRVYPGHDAAFKLYEDDGTTYDYEKGLSAWIPINWNDKMKVLTIGAREGHYPGMAANRKFSITMVDSTHGLGEAVAQPIRRVQYDGTSQQISLLPK